MAPKSERVFQDTIENRWAGRKERQSAGNGGQLLPGCDEPDEEELDEEEEVELADDVLEVLGEVELVEEAVALLRCRRR
eukprot:485868-Pyramimonas_sp.AAC.1